MVTIRERLSQVLTEDEMKLLKTSFDIVGDIAVIEIPDELRKREKIIAKALMEQHNNVKVVCKKVGPTAGVERIRPVKVIAGEKRTEAIHSENGCRLKLDINKAFFSPRLGTEHQRIVQQVKNNETVFDIFAGVGPFVIPIAKKCSHVIAGDINKDAVEYLIENARMNKVSDKIEAFVGDAKVIFKNKKFQAKADRVIMNLPAMAKDFLDVAFFLAKPKAVVHFYWFLEDQELYGGATDIIKNAAKSAGKKIRILEKRKCGQLGPRVWRVVVDFKVLN